MHDKPGVKLFQLPADPDMVAALLTEFRTDGKQIDGFLTLAGVEYVAIEQGY